LPVAWQSESTLVVVDYAGTRLVRIDRFEDGPGDFFVQRQAGDGAGGFGAGTFRDEPALYGERSADDLAAFRRGELRLFPEALLREALDRAATLQRLPSVEAEGRRLDFISFADAQGQRVLLGFDAATHDLVRMETLRDHPVYGDTSTELIFSDFRPVGALRLPFHAFTRVGDLPARDYHIAEIRLDPRWDPAWFDRPQARVAVETPPAEPVLRDLGGGVYAILGPYNVMFAVFHDYVLLVEAPVDTVFVASCYRLIASVAPGKPVRLVATHFHHDHIGGVRFAVAQGSPVWAPAEAREPIALSLASPRTLRPDVDPAPPRPLEFHAVEDRAIFTDGAQRVEIYDIGPTPHAAHMLVAVFPRARTILVADLWDVLSPELALTGRDGEILMHRLRALGVAFDRMVPVHGVPATRAQLERGLAIRARYLPPLDVEAWTRSQAGAR
jgi:glyoxylase-like metal-dependent hydrolase (beta-lactamase superfamily II)